MNIISIIPPGNDNICHPLLSLISARHSINYCEHLHHLWFNLLDLHMLSQTNLTNWLAWPFETPHIVFNNPAE